MKTAYILLTGILSIAIISPALGGECSAKSGERRVALLELYTSEGCNSCPPADEWVSRLPSKGLTSDRIIPLAFHVDYWNYLGWRDEFSQTNFTERQHQMAHINRSTFVYTPQLVLDGKDYRRGLLWDSTSEMVKQINQQKPLADISLTLSALAEGQLQVSGKIVVHGSTERQNTQAYLALYENNLTRDVKGGENNGRTLHHDFVVRELLGPSPVNAQGKVRLEQVFNLSREWKLPNIGVVAFVQNSRSGEVLQALSLPWCQ
ncbi:MAG TPA: DUF1223 domain-containing protein [Burkholderiales bacterium]|nr:DUF1223 domain-containing protein [Burkholderiales bacterium]